MPASSLPTEIILQIVRCMFQQFDLLTAVGANHHSSYVDKPLWHDIASVISTSTSMRQFGLQLWFSVFILRKPSDLRIGLELFPSLSAWIEQLVVAVSHTWSQLDLSVFERFQRLQRVAFIEHNDASPSEGNLFLIEALQRIPRTHLTRLSCSFADAEYLGSIWPYLGDFPQLQELRLLVCSPASCAKRPRLPRLALSEVRMPLLEDIHIEVMAQAFARLPRLRNLYAGVFTISRGSLLLHWGTHELMRRNNPLYNPWASDCLQCRADAMPEALRRAELASLALAKAAPSLEFIEWSSWFAPMKKGTLAFDVKRDDDNELLSINSVLYMV